ncbi:MAG TPA: tripartite tricarboxylate transporter substrate binding protein [Xanthobacteraceae bacterium]|nr:tripartite tricarboxylate transporter substrate binding protein [Xanthobacteraceae bacterium]
MKPVLTALALAASLTVPAQAADPYPNKSVRLVVPFPAGGATDVIARMLAQKASDASGQPFVIDNRGGAAGNIGSDNVAKSPGDGYSVLQTVSALSLSPALYRKLPFDPVKDLTAVSQLTASPLIIVANAKTGISSLKDLIDRAKAKPGALNFGSGGVANPQHLTMEMVKAAAGIDIVHIPFKGDAPLFTSLVAGDIELAVTPLSTALPHIEAGTLRAIAVTSPRRNAAFPDVPAVAETFPGFSSTSWQGWFVPASTPRDIVMKLNGYARTALQSPEVIAALKKFGSDPVGSSPEEFGPSFKAEVERFGKIVNDLKLPPQD